MKTRKNIMIIALCALMVIAVPFVAIAVYSGMHNASYSLSAAVGAETPETLVNDAENIIISCPTGKTTTFYSGRIPFVMTEVEVIKNYNGSLNEGERVYLLQTQDLDADIKLNADQSYLLFLDAYVAGEAEGMEKAEGSYVVKGAFKGVYTVDNAGEIGAVKTQYETEEQTVQRENAVKVLLSQTVKQ